MKTSSFNLCLFTGSFAGGVMSRNRQLAVRFLTGAWCLTCFVLVTAYSSVLLASLVAPDKFEPIINSADDLPNKPEIRSTVYKDQSADVLFQVNNESIVNYLLPTYNIYSVFLQSAVKDEGSTGIIKYIATDLYQNQENRCTAPSQCVDKVRMGTGVYIYVHMNSRI